ncbi:MAG: succinylglutamate desuccinylase [Alphaproteobacteria bacterium]|nr:MAG: succinylglutamate desuccinylase [Alphaproteobacteria bacterium]
MRRRERPGPVAKDERTKEARRRPRSRPAPFGINGESVPAGSVATIDLAISRLSTHTQMALPVRVVHGARPGPALFVSAAVHGDEIIGVEIIRRLLCKVSPRRLSGTLICVPVVNVFGFIMHQRYLPDRRDLNRSFPGSARGSLASQLAHVFASEIVERAQYGIDLHSAAAHRSNLPQIRITPDDPGMTELATAFGAPAVIHAPVREGSLRQFAMTKGVRVLLYESGEALRFDEIAIRIGVKGVLRVMAHLGMLSRARLSRLPAQPVHSELTKWVRAPEGGIFRAIKGNGERVEKGDVLGYLSDPFGDHDVPVTADMSGIVIGRTNLPIVNLGDALMHIAYARRLDTASERIDEIAEDVRGDPLFDEDELI